MPRKTDKTGAVGKPKKGKASVKPAPVSRLSRVRSTSRGGRGR